MPAQELPSYSKFFRTIHDEQTPTGAIGRGAHFSIVSTIPQPETGDDVHTLAVIWDEDHDTRVFEVIDSLYLGDLLEHVLFIGERKAKVTVLIDEYSALLERGGEWVNSYKGVLEDAKCALQDGDVFTLKAKSWNDRPGTIVRDTDRTARTYLNYIRMLTGVMGAQA